MPAFRRSENNQFGFDSATTISAEPAAHVAPRRTGEARTGGRRPMVEFLEDRTHMSVGQDAAGFTVVHPQNGSQRIYVSARGNDAANGLSPSSPVRTVAKGISKLRSGTGDQVLIERGQTYSGGLGYFNKSGRSPQEPLFIGTYGSGARPVLNTGGSQALSIGTRTGVRNLVVQGLKFQPSSTASVDGISMTGIADHVLIEDCEITRYVNNVVLHKWYGPITNIGLRRNVITDAYTRNGSNSEGLYAEAVNNLTLEENVFDHNGWGNGKPQTMFNHNAYIRATTTGLVARGNVFANASSHGLQARGGGIIENNVFIDNPSGLSFGLVNGSPVTPGGVTGRVVNNVFMGTRNIGTSIRGTAIEVGNVRRGGTTISGNVIANGTATTKLPAIQLAWGSGNENAYQAVGINDLTMANNVVYRWSVGLWVVYGQNPGGGQTALNNLKVLNNHFQEIQQAGAISPGSTAGTYAGNMYTTVLQNRAAKNVGASRVRVNYADPSRTPGRLVGGSNQTFVSLARGQSRTNWKSNLKASNVVGFVKGGFSVTGTYALN
jgi:hypothetical protein